MRILLVHQNFPGQFKHLGPALVARGDEVVAMGMRDLGDVLKVDKFGRGSVQGMRYVRSKGICNTTTTGHPWTRDFDSKVIRAAATMENAIALKGEGFEPDVILAHPAWGEAMFLKQVWPDARLTLYCEMMYRSEGGETNFDPEFASHLDDATEQARLVIRALPQSMLWNQSVAGICPTHFQASTFPEPMAHKISVIHDGIDTTKVAPGPGLEMRSTTGQLFRPDDEIITFVNRNLEPMRGYHRFIRALPALLRRRPKAHVILVGGESVSYSAAPPQGSWKQHFLNEVQSQLDMARVHFVGQLPYNLYLNVLRLSKLHVYLTYPFVPSWSLLEAMAIGLPVLGSATAPVEEFIRDGTNGLLVDFFDSDALVDKMCRLLEDRALATRLGTAARATAVDRYDLATVCLPQQLAWLDEVARD